MSTWMEEFGGVEYDCHPTNSILEYNGTRNQIKISADATIPAYPAVGTFKIVAADHFGGGDYVLPRAKNTLVAPPDGALIDIVSIALVGGDTEFTVSVKQRGSVPIELKAGDELIVLSGSEIADCECPEGQFTLPELPIESEMTMVNLGDKGELCGDALEACQYIHIPFLDINGQPIPEKSPWYTGEQQRMLRRFKKREYYEKLLNPTFGLVPKLRASGIKFTPASSTEITLADFKTWIKNLDQAGVMINEYAIFAGGDLYSQFQTMLLAAGVSKLDYSLQPLNDCKWINMEYCGLSIEGKKWHIYKDCTFSNGKELGSQNMNFPKSAIFVPLGNRPPDVKRQIQTANRFGFTDKMFNTVYFRSINGKTYNMDTGANGILGPRNTFRAGCVQQEWTVRSRFMLETYCMQSWGYIGLGT